VQNLAWHRYVYEPWYARIAPKISHKIYYAKKMRKTVSASLKHALGLCWVALSEKWSPLCRIAL